MKPHLGIKSHCSLRRPIAINIYKHLLIANGSFHWYVLIASTNIHDTAQLLIYVKGTDESLRLQKNSSTYVLVGHLAR